MDFLTALSLLFRRWYVVLVGAVVTMLATAAIFQAVPPTYQTSASVLLFFPPTPQTKDGSTNRYVSFNNLSVPASVLAEIMDQRPAREAVFFRGGTADFAILLDTTKGAPLLLLVVRGSTPEAVITTANMVLAEMQTQLEKMQQQVAAPKSTWIIAEVIARPDRAQPMNGSRLRMAIGVLVLGLAATIAMAFLVEAFVRRRVQRAAQAALPAAAPSSVFLKPPQAPQPPAAARRAQAQGAPRR